MEGGVISRIDQYASWAQDKPATAPAASAAPATSSTDTKQVAPATPATTPDATAPSPKCGDKGFDCNKGDVSWMMTSTAFVLFMTLFLFVEAAIYAARGSTRYQERYLFTLLPLVRSGLGLRRALPLAFASDTFSIVVMELVDNAVMVIVPGAMEPASARCCSGARCRSRCPSRSSPRSRSTAG